MLKITLAATASLAVTATLTAQQDRMGVENRVDTSFTSRGSGAGNSAPAVIFNKTDADAYAGWGYDTTQFLLGNRVIHGMSVINQDQVDTTAETFGVTIYTENITTPQPNFPDVATALAFGPFAYPLGTTGGPSAFIWTVTFGTPANVPAGLDVFCGQDLPQPLVGTWPTDGLSVHMIGYQFPGAGFTSWDDSGASQPAAPPEKAGNVGFYVASTVPPTLAYSNPRQCFNEPLLGATTGAVGAAGAITNQANALQSNVAPGSSSMASGLFPDAFDPPFNPGRADDFAERWFKTGTPDFDLVLFLRSFGGFGPEIPMEFVGTGWKGLICIDFASLDIYTFSATLAGEAFATTTLPPGPGIRSILAGVTIIQQAVCIHTADGTWETNFCTKQTF